MSTIFVKPYSGLVSIFICLENDSVRVSKYCNFKNIRLFNLNIKFQDLFFGVVFVLFSWYFVCSFARVLLVT